jgi:hypothetical protein
MKKTFSVLSGIVIGVISISLGILLAESGIIHMNSKKALRLEEPLLIEGEKQASYSLLPVGTVLYYDKNWEEGHSTYHVYFHFKGQFKSMPTDSGSIDPIWLRTIDRDELPKLMSDYPVSKDELISILRAKRATKQDIVQILSDWKD